MASAMACASSSCMSRRLAASLLPGWSSSASKASLSTLLPGLDGRNNRHVPRKAQGPQRPLQQHKPQPQPRHQQHYHQQPQQQQQQKRFFGMNDEYGTMDSNGQTYVKENFALENGVILPQAQLRYQTYGTLNDRRDNVLVVCHALTGNASLHTWWGELLGDGRAFDTSQYLVVCCNILGSCYGSTNPRSINPETGLVYGKDFPDVSVIDSVRLQLLLLQEELGIHSIKSVIGGSFGGMQAIEYAVQGGSQDADFVAEDGSPFVRSSIPIACGASHTAWQIAISEVQRQAIYNDPQWEKDGFGATKGLEVARQMGMISYRTPHGYHSKFGRQLQRTNDDTAPPPPLYGSKTPWQVKSYLVYQGVKFIDRFDPITYVKLTEQMDSHDVSRNRGSSIADVLRGVEIPVRVLGIDSDVLYPLSEQEEMAELLPNSDLQIIHSQAGHDGFLLEQDQVAKHIHDFLDQHE